MNEKFDFICGFDSISINVSKCHGLIKWTQHIGFLTLARMARFVEGNHGNDFKRSVARIQCLSSLAKFDYSLHFNFYESKIK